jgi:hypothetical protein
MTDIRKDYPPPWSIEENNHDNRECAVLDGTGRLVFGDDFVFSIDENYGVLSLIVAAVNFYAAASEVERTKWTEAYQRMLAQGGKEDEG